MSPRWLMDDVMVSFSAPGGSVGPHTDSYHTFLVQGIGKRAWKISNELITDDRYADNPDMKILEHGFDGETFEVTAGDIIYMPPFFGHEGKTLEAAMTFSVGFLGPKLSEMLGDYAQYIEENENLNKRYMGASLEKNDAGFSISATTQDSIKNDILATIQSDDFSIWMAGYFSTPTHDEIEEIQISNDELSCEEVSSLLQDGETFIRPEHIKITITKSSKGDYYLSAYGEIILVPEAQKRLIDALNQGAEISLENVGKEDDMIKFITAIYNKNFICLTSD
jgi:50S ribosomal protein L16 3-hydroxylase